MFRFKTTGLWGEGASLPVVNLEGFAQPFSVNVQDVEDAIVGLETPCQTFDRNLLG